MSTAFRNTRHRQTYQSVLSALRRIGYGGDCLQEGYTFGDWFRADRAQRVAPAAAFGYSPPSYDSACAAVLVPNGVVGAALVAQYRALGAPLAFEVNEDSVGVWRVGRDERSTAVASRITPDQIPAAFAASADVWSGEAILRAKNVSERRGSRQLDFVDLGLIPALEEQIREKLNSLFHEVLSRTEKAYRKDTGEKPDEKQLFRLVFRLLAAKVLHDRGADGFAALSPTDGAPAILQEVRRFYGPAEEVLASPAAQETALGVLWGGVGFQNLSVDTLAYIYENTLVSEPSRKRLGTHSTPGTIARYVIDHLPFEDCPRDERFVVEPCSGHCVLLTTAMKRLRGLLPAGMTPARRHAYFVKMLRGFETDLFALEVGKLCMMLADFPNANGWQLENRDVFASPSFTDALADARFVVCNPPFEEFKAEERSHYVKLRASEKPAELLLRVLDHVHPEACLGFVLPRRFTDGRGYRAVREMLARRFQDLEVVALPDKIFHVSQTESALLLARSPNNTRNATTVTFAEVEERDRETFLDSHRVSRRDVRRRSVEAVQESVVLPPLWAVWESLRESSTLGDVADFHHGVQWRSFSEEGCYSLSKRAGFRPGYTQVRRQMVAFEPLTTEYLNFAPDNIRRAGNLPWSAPKVVVNAARSSRGPWRVIAFPDSQSHTFTKRFIGVWPRREVTIPVESLAAVMNGPLANAFVYGHERGRDNQSGTLERVPLPTFDAGEWNHLAELVRGYVAVTQSRLSDATAVRSALYRIDAYLLAGYNLPPHLERKLLKVFDGEARPVSCEFLGYDVETFAAHRALGTADASPDRITRLRERRGVLAQKLVEKRLTPAEDRELADIDQVLDRYSDTVSPLPFDLLEHWEGKARLQGVGADPQE